MVQLRVSGPTVERDLRMRLQEGNVIVELDPTPSTIMMDRLRAFGAGESLATSTVRVSSRSEN